MPATRASSRGLLLTRAGRRGPAVLPLAVALALAPLTGAAQPKEPGRVSATATLSILTAPASIQRVPAGAATPELAKDGTSLAVGDRVLTGPGRPP